MAKIKKKTNKKDAGVPKPTSELNNIIKKQEQESKSVPKVPKVTVEMLLDAIPDAKVNKRQDGFVKFIEGDCYVRDISYWIQVSENFHRAREFIFLYL
jgi:hypothetical protein